MPKIGYLQAFGYFWKHYADFSGRTTKEAFWKAFLVLQVINFAMSLPVYPMMMRMIKSAESLFVDVMENMVNGYGYVSDPAVLDLTSFDYGAFAYIMLVGIFSLVLIIPWIALIVRRFHDIDRHGAHVLLIFIPIAGVIIMLVMLARPSAPYHVYPGQSGGPYPYEQRPNAPNSGQRPTYGQPSPYTQQQSSYTQQPYGQQTYYYGPPKNPRRFSPYAGGNDATVAIVLFVIVYIATTVYTYWASNNYTKELNDLFYDLNTVSTFEFDDGIGSIPMPEYVPDPLLPGGSGDDRSRGHDDFWNENGLTEEEQAAIDKLKESTIEGLPEFTIEEVLMSRADSDGLQWDFFESTYEQDVSFYVIATGYTPEGDSLYADFSAMKDGRVVITNIMVGDRDEYDQRAKDLYNDWYREIQTYGGLAKTA